MSSETEWHKRWQHENIGWHRTEPNEHLLAHSNQISFDKKPKILVPLCGKSQDLLWLAQRGAIVIGIELVEKAIIDFFQEWGVDAKRIDKHGCPCYQFDSITIFCGNFFDLSAEQIGTFDVIYDRASLVALPPSQRERYIAHQLHFLKPTGLLLLISFDLPVPETKGPPYPVRKSTIPMLYRNTSKTVMLGEHKSTPKTDQKLKQRGLSWSRTAIWRIER